MKKTLRQMTAVVLAVILAFVFVPFLGQTSIAYASQFDMGSHTYDFIGNQGVYLDGKDMNRFTNTMDALENGGDIEIEVYDDETYTIDLDLDGKSDISVDDDPEGAHIVLFGDERNAIKTLRLTEEERNICDMYEYEYYSEVTFVFHKKHLGLEYRSKVEKVASVKDYTGSVIKPTPKVWYGDKLLTKGTDYKLTYGNNTKIGSTGSVTVTGIGEYEGSVKQTFTIKGNLGNAATKVSVQPIAKKVYDGKAKTPTPWVKAVLPGGSVGTLTKGTSYTLSYKNNVNVGKASLIITGKNKYRGTKTVYFTISPKGTSMSGLRALSKGFKVTWNKQTVQTSGYDIIYSTRSDFKTYTIKTVSGNTNTVKSITGLKGKTKYYVKVRTYKMVNGVKYLSKWSAVKYITTKA